ncbi:MAG: hypothetical protein IJ429_02725 [Lachnospiraceae bacterium]|nr:hypothetical protein [Lachnospiraceae bacterium]
MNKKRKIILVVGILIFIILTIFLVIFFPRPIVNNNEVVENMDLVVYNSQIGSKVVEFTDFEKRQLEEIMRKYNCRLNLNDFWGQDEDWRYMISWNASDDISMTEEWALIMCGNRLYLTCPFNDYSYIIYGNDQMLKELEGILETK